jgi:hypothetical protein
MFGRPPARTQSQHQTSETQYDRQQSSNASATQPSLAATTWSATRERPMCRFLARGSTSLRPCSRLTGLVHTTEALTGRARVTIGNSGAAGILDLIHWTEGPERVGLRPISPLNANGSDWVDCGHPGGGVKTKMYAYCIQPAGL